MKEQDCFFDLSAPTVPSLLWALPTTVSALPNLLNVASSLHLVVEFVLSVVGLLSVILHRCG